MDYPTTSKPPIDQFKGRFVRTARPRTRHGVPRARLYRGEGRHPS